MRKGGEAKKFSDEVMCLMMMAYSERLGLDAILNH